MPGVLRLMNANFSGVPCTRVHKNHEGPRTRSGARTVQIEPESPEACRRDIREIGPAGHAIREFNAPLRVTIVRDESWSHCKRILRRARENSRESEDEQPALERPTARIHPRSGFDSLAHPSDTLGAAQTDAGRPPD